MTISRCKDLAAQRGLKFAAVRAYSQCYGGASTNGLVQAESGMCRTPCVGNREQACGGFCAVSVYNAGKVKGGGALARAFEQQMA